MRGSRERVSSRDEPLKKRLPAEEPTSAEVKTREVIYDVVSEDVEELAWAASKEATIRGFEPFG